MAAGHSWAVVAPTRRGDAGAGRGVPVKSGIIRLRTATAAQADPGYSATGGRPGSNLLLITSHQSQGITAAAAEWDELSG